MTREKFTYDGSGCPIDHFFVLFLKCHSLCNAAGLLTSHSSLNLDGWEWGHDVPRKAAVPTEAWLLICSRRGKGCVRACVWSDEMDVPELVSLTMAVAAAFCSRYSCSNSPSLSCANLFNRRWAWWRLTHAWSWTTEKLFTTYDTKSRYPR